MTITSIKTGLLVLSATVAFTACAASGGFPPERYIELDPGENGPFTPPKAGPDWYTFSLDSFESVTIHSERINPTELQGIEPTATLMNASGEVITTVEDNAPREQFRIEQSLEAGTYYLRIEDPGPIIDRDEHMNRYMLYLE
ncbi:hypothetical protein [Marinobacter sp.]|uniref:hypothetical protein n=1 Tax=Marinobacter sp. TaxID=50741 RepID=UPI00384C9CF0